MMPSLLRALQLTLLALAVHFPLYANAALFGVHQNGKYWGANIDTTGSASNIKFDFYPTFSRPTGTVSYDPVTSQSLFELYQPHAIAFGPMCTNSNGFQPQVLFNVSDIMVERPDIGDSIGGSISAFAIYDSEIYFLHHGTYMTEEQEVYHIFQIRKFLTCEECRQDPYEEDSSNSALPLSFSVECSRKVTDAVVINSEEDMDIIFYEFQGGKSLKVTKQPGSDTVDFYFQIGKIRLYESGQNTVEMILYKANSLSSTEEIHSQSVNGKFYDWEMYAIGSVDYKDGLLCWTTCERLFCRDDDVGTVEELVNPTDIVLNEVCSGDDAKHLMDISGVTIVKNHDNKQAIAFGCSPNSQQITGAGLITKTKGGEDANIQPLEADGQPLSAGSVFSVQALQETCTYEPRPSVCVRLAKTTIPPPTTTSLPESTPKPEPEGEGGPEVKPGTEIDGSENEVEGKPVHGGGGAGQVAPAWLLLLNTIVLTALALILS